MPDKLIGKNSVWSRNAAKHQILTDEGSSFLKHCESINYNKMITFEQGMELLKAKAQKKADQLKIILEEKDEEKMLMFILGTSDLLRNLVFRHLDLGDQMRLLKITESIHDTVTQKQ